MITIFLLISIFLMFPQMIAFFKKEEVPSWYKKISKEFYFWKMPIFILFFSLGGCGLIMTVFLNFVHQWLYNIDYFFIAMKLNCCFLIFFVMVGFWLAEKRPTNLMLLCCWSVPLYLLKDFSMREIAIGLPLVFLHLFIITQLMVLNKIKKAT